MDSSFDCQNLKETAVFHLMAMETGLLSVDEVVAWCDEVIATHPDPPLAIINASMVKGQKHNEVENELALLEGKFDEAAVLRWLFGKMANQLSHNPVLMPRIAAALNTLNDAGFSLDEATKSEIGYFDTYTYFCGDDIFRDEAQRQIYKEKITKEMLDFLQHAARSEVTNYAGQHTSLDLSEYYMNEKKEAIGLRSKIPGLVYEALIVGLLTAIAVLLVKSQEQAGSGFGWGEVTMLLAIVAVYVGVSKWRRKK